MTKSKLIGDRRFYSGVLKLTMPIILQNLITNFVSLLDNFMVGRLGTEQMSGVSIANQILLIVYLAVFGGLSGVGIFTSQFYGKKDDDGIRYTLRFKIYEGLGILLLATSVLLLFRNTFITLFLHDTDAGSIELTRAFADSYILIMLIGLLPFIFAQVIALTLRETGNTIVPMVSSMTAVATNALFNYILIFGKFGAPRLEVKGAAIATVISRFAEFIILLVYILVKRDKFTYVNGLTKSFIIPKKYLSQFCAKSLSLMCNEILWAGSQTALSIAYSLHSLDVVAAYSMSSTVINLFFIFGMSMGVATGILVGKELGAGRHTEAIDITGKLVFLSFAGSVITSLLLACFGRFIPQLYNTSDTSRELAAYFIVIAAVFMPMDAICNSSYFTLRSGGKTVLTVIFDSGSLWLLSVPVAFACYYLFHLDIMTVYPIVVSLQAVKAFIGLFLLRSRIWVNTIV